MFCLASLNLLTYPSYPKTTSILVIIESILVLSVSRLLCMIAGTDNVIDLEKGDIFSNLGMSIFISALIGGVGYYKYMK